MGSHSFDPRGHMCGNNLTILARSIGAFFAVFLLCLPLVSQTSQGTIQAEYSISRWRHCRVPVIDVARGVTQP